MSVSEDILKLLIEPKLRYNGVWVSRVGLPTFLFCKKKVVSDTISQLKKNKYVLVEGDSIKITEHGKRFLVRRQVRLKVFESPFAKSARKNLLLVFDIPEVRKAEREWFRRQLRTFGYVMIQKSVWVGPSPLPKAFISYVKAIQLESGIKTFRLAGGYAGGNRKGK